MPTNDPRRGKPDRAFDPNRRPVNPSASGSDGGPPPPRLHWSDKGVDRNVKDLGWLQRNASHATHVTFSPSQDPDYEAVLKVQGVHPERGPFEHSVGFSNRDAMRQWVTSSPRFNHVFLEDRMRDSNSVYPGERSSHMRGFEQGSSE